MLTKLSKIRTYIAVIIPALLAFSNSHGSTVHPVDVLVLYTDAAKTFLDKKSIKVEDEINGYITFSNEVFKRSQVNMQYNLVYQGYADWLSSIKESSSSNLGKVVNDQRVHQLRSYFGADLVVVLTKSSYQGGIARGVDTTRREVLDGEFDLRHKISPFALVGVSPSKGVDAGSEEQQRYQAKANFLHEVGHAMGLGHDFETDFYYLDTSFTDAIEKKAEEQRKKYLEENNLLSFVEFSLKDEYQGAKYEKILELYNKYLIKHNARSEESFQRELVEEYIGGIYKYSTGFKIYKNEKSYGTIMSYAQNLPYFSNPNIKCSSEDLSETGIVCGSADDNAAKSLNLSAPSISNFCSASKRDRSDLSMNFELVKLIPESEAETIDFDFNHAYYNEFSSKDQFGIYPWNKTGILNFDTENKQVVDDEGNSSTEKTNVLTVQDSKYFPAVGFELSCVAEKKKVFAIGASVKSAKPGKSTLWLYYELAALDLETDTQVKKWLKLDEKDTNNKQFTDLEAGIRLPDNITVVRLAITSTDDNTLIIDSLAVAKEK
ncbi:hypothetical protein H0A36_27260 [Endozoicomonas sp. SM1973]|uniref:Uncharacterized protein n=1 Tax=Spartinivicinus marinus TaxID=2994442 RepID=A0A853IGR4_9GAMM|nr:zinc-dependent metalloprotease family protein [Spartinivicinus marinus]MCX4025147.1 M12 family metallo-peptidase [Spartinivicinus marinus]NYZ69718.1 hypothetical protein [Spartinivicinus marinus]